MKDPSLSTHTAPTGTPAGDVILSSQFGSDENPFAEYMWMENEEEFNRQVEEKLWEEEFIERCFPVRYQLEEELWEEEFIERCFQEMLDEEEQWEWFIPSRDLPSGSVGQLQEQLSLLILDGEPGDLDVPVKSHLNPNAKEFTPGMQQHSM